MIYVSCGLFQQTNKWFSAKSMSNRNYWIIVWSLISFSVFWIECCVRLLCEFWFLIKNKILHLCQKKYFAPIRLSSRFCVWKFPKLFLYQYESNLLIVLFLPFPSFAAVPKASRWRHICCWRQSAAVHRLCISALSSEYSTVIYLYIFVLSFSFNFILIFCQFSLFTKFSSCYASLP